MDIIQLFILGILEGFTEFLPISSTAHLILASRLFQLGGSEFMKSFTIAIQLGAILAVVFLYAWRLVINPGIGKKTLVAFLPTAVVGFLLYKTIKGVLFESLFVIIISLFAGGIILIIFELLFKEKETSAASMKDITYTQAFMVGCAQSLAVIPGVSRAAATIIGGMFAGIKRVAIVEFSFVLAVPTMAAATGYDLFKNAGGFSASQFHLLAAGFVISFFAALLGVKFLLNLIQRHSFIGFGIYRVIAALIFFLLLFYE
ncbi:MAG: undecaprenyl-diphosphate phosphatase [Candidatus Yanofskybacteria bacterium]|nr:undecaprenyl-diphosphate phosphatase [Candidatus Yanofskybacteria bacterium]